MRTAILIASLLVALLLAPSAAGAWPAAPMPTLGFDQAAALAVKFDAAYDAIPAADKVGITTQAELDAWVKEMVPFYAYEGVTEDYLLVYPDSVTFAYYDGGQAHNHIAGQTNCFTSDVTLNARYANPESPWFNRPDAIATLAHELAHAQGVCFKDRLDAEASAQLVMLEVLSAMVDKDNTKALAPLVGELRAMALDAAEYAADLTGRQADYRALEARVFDPWELARSDKSDRYWATDPDTLTMILSSYNYTPLLEVTHAVAGNGRIAGVALPINTRCFPPVSYDGGTQEVDPGCAKPLVVDDLAYVLGHLSALVAAL